MTQQDIDSLLIRPSKDEVIAHLERELAEANIRCTHFCWLKRQTGYTDEDIHRAIERDMDVERRNDAAMPKGKDGGK